MSIIEEPFSVEPTRSSKPHYTSRIRFDTTYKIRYNLKVLELGTIKDEEELERLARCWQKASV